MDLNSSTIEIGKIFRKHTPVKLSGIGIAMFVHSVISENERYLYKHMRRVKSNNWLKRHGYPMRRKSHRR